MKQRVDMYIMAAADFNGCWPFVCQLLEKAYLQGHTTLVQTESAAANESLDNFLWTFRNTSFIPHQRLDPCTLAIRKGLSDTQASLLVNCQLAETPARLLENQRFLQIVPNQPSLLPLARQHYRFYQQQGYQITTHQIK